VFLVRRGPDGWTGERIAKLGGEMIQCAIGDPDPTHAGNELVVVGMLEGEEDSGGKGAVHLVRREGDGWTVEKVGEAEALVHGVAIGEVDGEHAGDEIVTVGFDRRIRVFAWAEGGWKVVSATDLPAPAKTAIVLRGEAVVANTGTDLVGYRLERLEVFPAGESTPSRDAVLMARTVAAVGVAQARLGTDGGRILVACDDGGLRLVEGETVTVLHREEKKLRGAVLADLDPSKEGIEAATTGYGGAVTLLYPPADPEGAWTPVVLWQDAQPLHHLAAGDVDPTTPGPEIVAVGFGGRVLVAARR
jgi:hypothetical protein